MAGRRTAAVVSWLEARVSALAGTRTLATSHLVALEGPHAEPLQGPRVPNRRGALAVTRLWTVSDLHLQAGVMQSPKPLTRVPAADVAVVAGDVFENAELSLRWLAGVIGLHMPVIAVLGNHEFWGGAMPTVRARARRVADEVGVHLLDDSSSTVAGVRFVGGTLWTDFQLDGPFPAQAERSMQAARTMADFRQILHAEPQSEIIPRNLLPGDTARLHAATRAFIDGELARPHNGPSVVVTHHAPSPASVSQAYLGDPRNAAYASDLSTLIERRQPSLWVHGHMHATCSYNLGQTRVICNPHGFLGENPLFEPELVIEVINTPQASGAAARPRTGVEET